MKKSISLFIVLLSFCAAFAQHKTENVIIITMDGMRWQEVFGGIDSALMNNPAFSKDSAGLRKQYWDADATMRKEKLFPFLWNTIAARGQLYGNRWLGNRVDVANR
ncbi:MAG TPA: hypothetical protein VM187_01970, partial [Niastella sp.]|nr:hypothetical protein [Niastella sp.]